MESPPERSSRSYAKRDAEDSSDVKSDRGGDDDEWDGSDKRKHRSTKSRKSTSGDDAEGFDGSGRRRSSTGDRSDSRKRGGGCSSAVSIKAGSDEDDYETRKDTRSKQLKKKQDESSLEKLSSWYQDGELDNKQGGGDKSVSKGHVQPDESERRKLTSKISKHEGSRTAIKSKEERSYDGENEKALDRDTRYSERKDSSREKGHSSAEAGKNSRRRGDESDSNRKAEETLSEKPGPRSGKVSDSKYESKERSARNEPSESKSRGLDSNSEKGVKTSNRDDRRVEAEREKYKSKGRSETAEEDNRASPLTREDRSGRETIEKHREQRTPTRRDVAESHERSSNAEEDGNTWTRDKGAREVGRSNRSKTPERGIRRHQDLQQSEIEYERNVDMRRKDQEKDGYRDDRSKGRDDSWNDRNRDRESSKENWKRRQSSGNDREPKDGDIAYDRSKDWEPRHGRERNDNERPHGRSRGEAVKTSSNFGISNDNYDVIEVPLDHGRPESRSNFARRIEANQQSDGRSAPNTEEWAYMQDERARRNDSPFVGDSKEKYMDDDAPMRDPSSWRDDIEYHGGKGRGQKGAMPSHGGGGQSSSSGSQPPYGNQDSGSFGRGPLQGLKGSRVGRGGRVRPAGRDNQQVGLPLPLMGSPFGHLGMPHPGALQPLAPSMSPAPGPPISPGVFIPPFSPPVVWAGARGVEMNMLGVPPVLSAVPPGPAAPRFSPNMGTPPSNPAIFFNQAGPGRGVPPSISGPGFNASGPVGRGTPPDKSAGGWVPPRNNGPPGKAPSRGEQNDYSQNFVDTGMRPQNFIRELELTSVVEDYPKLRELIQKKDEIVAKSASPPMYMKCDLHEFELSPEFFGTKFDVILVDPPWEEYVHRAPGVADHMEYWTYEEILNLKIEVFCFHSFHCSCLSIENELYFHILD
jgi:hypothetical protein